MIKKPLVSVIIPNWNGEKLLRKNLPKVLAVLPENTEVIIIDNGSTDESVKFIDTLAWNKITVKLLKNKENLGFIKACNQGVRIAKGEFVVLMNNDVVPEKRFLEPTLKHFKNKKIFAVSLNERGDKWSGWVKIYWSDGFFNYEPGGISKRAHISGWASGGGAVFRKEMWIALSGFDELYHPFYWEDLDLSYRAWKKGWKVFWEPKAIVEHHHESTISRLDKNFVNLTKERNQLLFIWKNISDPYLKISHFFGLLLRVLMGPNYLKVVFSALKQCLRFQRPKSENWKLTDREVLEMFK